jgi:hypothetical protein
MPDFKPGQGVIWLMTTRGGYNWTIPVKARIVRVTAKRVIIDALMSDLTWTRKTVKPENLRTFDSE